MKNFSLKTKLFLLSFFLLSISLAVGFTSYQFSNETVVNFNKIVDISVPKLQLTYKMMLSYRRVRITLRTLGLKQLPPEEADKAVAETLAAIDQYETENAEMVKMGFIPGQKDAYDLVQDRWLKFKAVGEEVLRLQKANTPQAQARMQEIFLKDCPQHAKDYTEAVDALIRFNEEAMVHRAELARDSARTSNHVILGIILLGGLVGLLIGFLIASGITKSIAKVAQDLSLGAEQVNQAAGQISESSQSLSQSSTQQASALEETVATMEEITSMVQRNTENGKQAANLASATRDIALKGEHEIKQLIESIYTISADSKKIEEITGVIDDIAFQTNLLALNAAVEAARAGEQGKGFAVVAEAVRTLAQRSSLAAKDIADLIKSSVEKIDAGSHQATQSGAVLSEIVGAIKKVADINGEIAIASEEQNAGVHQIGKALNQLDQGTQQNAAGAEEAAAAAEELSAQSSVLRSNVSVLEATVFGRSASPATPPRKTDSPRNFSAPTIRPAASQGKLLKMKSPKASPSSREIPFDEDLEADATPLGKVEDF